MSVRDVFSARLVVQEEQSYPGSPNYLPFISEDITSGILNVDIVEGNDVYEGPWQQVDTGQFTIVTRNPNMDPKVNPNVKYNARIEFMDSRTVEFPNSNTFFTGWITDVNVEYQRNDDPIITINGTDILGVLQRTIVTQEMYDAIVNYCTNSAPALLETGIDFEFFMYYVDQYVFKKQPGSLDYKYKVSYGFVGGAPGIVGALPGSEGVLAYRPASYFPKVGETVLEVINKYAQTNLDYFSLEPGLILIYPLAKYNGAYWRPVQDPAIEFPTYQFSSDPADNKPYESILINNGYERTINQIEVSNESRFFVGGELQSETNSFGDYTVLESTEDWAATKARLETILDVDHANDAELSRYATDIFQIIAFPSDEIEQITFNNARYEDIQNDITRSFNRINQFVRIKHKVNNTQTIDRFYDIAGITHSISPDEWVMGYTLKPSQQEIAFTYQGQVPTLQMNALTGDTNFNFTATITDYPVEDIDYVLWDLNQIDGDSEVYFYASAFSGEKFKDGLKRTGLTQTWNFDDDGILAPYDPVSGNIFGGYGAGNWWVTAYLFLKNGFTIAVQKAIIVGTPQVEADFVWSQNLTNNFGQVQFTDTSVNHETGEPDSYLWTFGDGTTSTEKNPLKTYVPVTNENSYSVSLRVFAYGQEGQKVYNTKTSTVTLTQPTMTANFTWVANVQTVTFTNTSTNVGFEEPDAYLWEFGDGTTSTLKNPVHTFPVTDVNTPQTFSVKLTTRNIWEQTANVTKTVTTTALNKSGTFPVRYIKFSIDPYTRPGVPGLGEIRAINPVMSVLKATTSGTGQNLAYLKPLTGFQIDFSPTLQNRATGGGNIQAANGSDFFLTRDIQTDPAFYGIGPNTRSSSGDTTWRTVRWELVVDLGATTQLLDNINLRFEDLGTLLSGVLTLRIEDFYPRINVQFATTITDVTPNPAGVFGPGTRNGNWVDVGYIKLPGGRMDPTKPSGQRTNTTKNIFKMRPLPLNIPYFNYTFNDKIVSFTALEDADSYYWTFGDQTLSTERNPVKTYANYGTYNVKLEVTKNGVLTRTTVEPVIVQAPVI